MCKMLGTRAYVRYEVKTSLADNRLSAMATSEKITWDEDIIAEHDKLRGTRMKIDEPDTPYERDYDMNAEPEEEDDRGKTPQNSLLDPDAIAAALGGGSGGGGGGGCGGGLDFGAVRRLHCA